MIEIAEAKLSELTEIMAIENEGFSQSEAATPKAMKERIEKKFRILFLLQVRKGKF